MKNLKYFTKSNSYKNIISYTFRKKTPKFVIEILNKILLEKITIEKFITNSGINSNSQIYSIIKKAFENYEEFYDDFNEKEITKIVENGYKEITKKIEANIYSLLPLVDIYEVDIYEKRLKLKNEKEFKKEILKYLETIHKNGSHFKLNSLKKEDEKNEKYLIYLKIEDGTLKCNNEKINFKELNFEELLEENELQKIENINKIEKIPKDWLFLKNDIDIDKFQKQNYNLKDYWFEIKENSIEFLEIKNWNKLTIYNKNVIRIDEFEKETNFYNLILKAKEENPLLTLNNFIFLKFLKEKEKVTLKILKNKKELEKMISNDDILRNVLLLDEKIILDVKINKLYVEKIIESSSIPQLPIIISKLTDEFKDSLLSPKTLNKISNVDRSLLSKKQLEIIQNEEKKKELIRQEYFSIIGEITDSGIREKIKQFSKQKKKELKIDKKFKKWIDSYIGHNKETIKNKNQEIQEKELNKAKQILAIVRKISSKI